jgi:SPBc2 prophage-derived uncharacterized protein yotM|nr:MAG TPA: penicillin-binding protein-related factor A [Herelleviridae sp.]
MKVNKGYVLQDNIKKSCEKQDILFYRFKDSPFSFANSDKTKFTINNICDCMMFLANKLLFVELKSTKGKSFSFTERSLRQLNDINKIIHNKQGLKRFGVYGCFIIEFRELEETYFIQVQDILNYLNENNTKTINIQKYIKNNKFVKVEQKLLRKNYTFDIRKLFIDLGRD